ncbi:hypothetical protein DFH06DRAFT_1134689 [Mycena polygramma]|nr:hypothetical protein DFH06DRAFT_1134689 [Mycena polygramma]
MKVAAPPKESGRRGTGLDRNTYPLAHNRVVGVEKASAKELCDDRGLMETIAKERGDGVGDGEIPLPLEHIHDDAKVRRREGRQTIEDGFVPRETAQVDEFTSSAVDGEDAGAKEGDAGDLILARLGEHTHGEAIHGAVEERSSRKGAVAITISGDGNADAVMDAALAVLADDGDGVQKSFHDLVLVIVSGVAGMGFEPTYLISLLLLLHGDGVTLWLVVVNVDVYHVVALHCVEVKIRRALICLVLGASLGSRRLGDSGSAGRSDNENDGRNVTQTSGALRKMIPPIASHLACSLVHRPSSASIPALPICTLWKFGNGPDATQEAYLSRMQLFEAQGMGLQKSPAHSTNSDLSLQNGWERDYSARAMRDSSTTFSSMRCSVKCTGNGVVDAVDGMCEHGFVDLNVSERRLLRKEKPGVVGDNSGSGADEGREGGGERAQGRSAGGQGTSGPKWRLGGVDNRTAVGRRRARVGVVIGVKVVKLVIAVLDGERRQEREKAKTRARRRKGVRSAGRSTRGMMGVGDLVHIGPVESGLDRNWPESRDPAKAGPVAAVCGGDTHVVTATVNTAETLGVIENFSLVFLVLGNVWGNILGSILDDGVCKAPIFANFSARFFKKKIEYTQWVPYAAKLLFQRTLENFDIELFGARVRSIKSGKEYAVWTLFVKTAGEARRVGAGFSGESGVGASGERHDLVPGRRLDESHQHRVLELNARRGVGREREEPERFLGFLDLRAADGKRLGGVLDERRHGLG